MKKKKKKNLNQYKNTSEAAVASVKSIATACKRSGTVKRLVFTASVFASSPLKDDGSGFKDFVDETCWSPSNLSVPYGSDFLKVLTLSFNCVSFLFFSYVCYIFSMRILWWG